MKAKFVLSSLGVALFTPCGCGDYDSINPAAYLSNNSPHDIVVDWERDRFWSGNKSFPLHIYYPLESYY